MAMSIGGLKAKIISNLQAFLTDWFNPIDDHRLGYDFDYYVERFAEAIAKSVYDEITTNARATGQDSNSDTHSLDIEWVVLY